MAKNDKDGVRTAGRELPTVTAVESVKRKLNFDNDNDSIGGTSALCDTAYPVFKKRLEANFDAYLKDFPVSASSADIISPGWEIFLNFDVTRMLDVFPEQHRENVQNLYNIIVKLIKRYYVKIREFIEQIASEEKVPLKEFYTTNNDRIVEIRRTYDLNEEMEKERDYLSLKMQQDDMWDLYASVSTLVSLFIAAKVQKPSYIVNKMVKATHITCFKPFYDEFDIAFFSQNVTITPNQKVLNYLANPTADKEGFDLKSEPYLTLDGYLLVLCERAESRGMNSSGKSFNVLNVISPSDQILREYFNKFIRDMFPHMFNSLSSMMFFNIVEVRQVPKIFCLNHRKALKNQVLVSVNLAKIFLVEYKETFVPQVQMYTNCIFEQK